MSCIIYETTNQYFMASLCVKMCKPEILTLSMYSYSNDFIYLPPEINMDVYESVKELKVILNPNFKTDQSFLARSIKGCPNLEKITFSINQWYCFQSAYDVLSYVPAGCQVNFSTISQSSHGNTYASGNSNSPISIN